MNPLILNLAKLKPFKNLTIGELETIFKKNGSLVERYSDGELIRQRGDQCNSLLIILEGKVSTIMQDTNGRMVKLETIEAPNLIASGVLFASDNLFPVDIIATSSVIILSMSKNLVIELCMNNENFLTGLLNDMGDRLAMLAEKVYIFSLNTLKEKLARYLLERSNGKTELTLGMTKEELSRYFGVARPSLSRAFAELIKEGYIAQNNQIIRLLDREGLKELSGME
ncbi:Crp/Fnr family transcriptional regulator [Kosmotoga pacifica]|uniref:Crp/Fnr family transcriptional regulator n=1 Tax=Kosmotoga pacifica TaxID=1330330 RepID=A0A0G2ZEV3_9BACT|nr:Crp/Fnr family transcriptional regulator [Kosmotoga pacifica]AKI97363.1 hypothetical protein IX53_05505 [Kosmotoga pacifica]